MLARTSPVFGRNIANTSHDRQRVLKNTYSLLSLSMLPTIAGAWLGMELGIDRMMQAAGPLMSFAAFMLVAFSMIWAIRKNMNSAMGIVLLLALTGFMGLMLAPALSATLAKSGGAQTVILAAGGTATIFAGMSILATIIRRDLSSMGKFLFVGMIMLIVATVGNIFLGSSALSLALSTMAVGLFSAFLLYDMKRILDGGETNYVSATLGIYLSLFNIFSSLLSLLGLGSSD